MDSVLNEEVYCAGSCGDKWKRGQLCLKCGRCFYCCEDGYTPAEE